MFLEVAMREKLGVTNKRGRGGGLANSIFFLGGGDFCWEGSYNPPPLCHAMLKLCGQGHIPNRHHGKPLWDPIHIPNSHLNNILILCVPALEDEILTAVT